MRNDVFSRWPNAVELTYIYEQPKFGGAVEFQRHLIGQETEKTKCTSSILQGQFQGTNKFKTLSHANIREELH